MNQQQQQDLFNKPFTPPALMNGQPVMWWPRGVRGTGNMVIGFAQKANTNADGGVVSRGATIYLITGRLVDACPHCDDPRIQLNADQRENGGWEYTEYHRWFLGTTAKMEECNRQFSGMLQARRGNQPKPKEDSPAGANSEANAAAGSTSAA